MSQPNKRHRRNRLLGGRANGGALRNINQPHPWRERLAMARSLRPSVYLQYVRVPFFKGHGTADANAFNQRYLCDCGHGIVAPLDDDEFMTDVMDHELEHAEAAS